MDDMTAEPRLIELQRMPQQEGVRVAEDDWTGSTDAAERRKRQNRLHQRLYRKRQKLLKLQNAPNSQMNEKEAEHNHAQDHKADSLLPIDRSESQSTNSEDCPNALRYLDPVYRRRLYTPGLPASHVQELIKQVENYVARQYTLGSPHADLLLTLIQFNVFRALVDNTFTLGFSLDWLGEFAESPFNDRQMGEGDTRCPASLRSTELQRRVAHHPWIDLFPFPALRDNLLSQGEEYEDDDLCHDLVEVCHTPSERSGLIVWGTPWDPASWEVTEEFAVKWAWMLRGCHELLKSTNYWRERRGEEELLFDVMPSKQLDQRISLRSITPRNSDNGTTVVFLLTDTL